ncbi:MAG: CoB--CoM heterodisulfide reductase iron-sulfur subunit B family protein [Desulfosarcinaceae bacterium]|jgi:heterodisulfide reductase subunit B
MKVSYYPGCSLEETAQAYDVSARRVCQHLGIDLEEIPQWSCCGSSPGLKMNHLLSTSLGAHNLAQAQRQELSEVVIPCPFCFRRLLSAKQEVQADRQLKTQVEDAIGAELHDDLNVSNLLGFLRYSVGLDTIGANVKKPLAGLKVLPYYGCYLVKPGAVTGYDDPENPVSMDQILASLGAEVLPWDFKTECCGASLAVSKTDVVRELSGRLIREATWRGADALVVACQLCQANLDLRQAEIGRLDKKKYALPILYFTQLIGLAFGLPYTDLGLKCHIVNPKHMLASKDVLQ